MLAIEPGWITRLKELHLFTPARVLAILIGAIVVTIILRRVVGRLLRRMLDMAGVDRTRAEARQRGLATVMRSALVGMVWAIAVITIISEVGINIGAFVATATIVGGAIAFGAQTLVRDALAGMFVLAEDQYGVGDLIDVGLVKGTVDRITLRAVRLRDIEGVEWHVPHGNIARVANLSKAPNVRLLAEVDRHSDPDRVSEVLQALVVELVEQVGTVLSAAPMVPGLIDIRDDRLVYLVLAPAPAAQRDEVNRVWRALLLAASRRGDLVMPGNS